MRKRAMIRTGVVLAMAAMAGVIVVSGALAAPGIAGSDHDFSNDAWSNNQICLPCHTPHNAITTTIGAPLWNHEETTATFSMYTTIAGNTGTMDGPSKLCLSCHDGVTAVDNYGGNTGGTTFVAGAANLGTDLTDDHPIGIAYPPPNTTVGDYKNPPSSTQIKLIDVNGTPRVECSTCHDPHNGQGIPKFLRVTDDGSQICLACHNK